MGNDNSINELHIYGHDTLILTADYLEHRSHDSTDYQNITYIFEDEIKDKCYELLSKIQNKELYVKVGYHNNIIYYISNINKYDRYYSSNKISRTSYGWIL